MAPIVNLSAHMTQEPVRHLRLTPVEPPRPDAPIENGLTVLLEWFGAEGVQNFLDYIDEHGTQDLRRRLATLLAVKGGR